MRILPTHLESQATPQQIAAARKTAVQFESMVLGQMLQPIFATADFSKSSFFGGAAEQTWRPMMVDEIAKDIARSGGLGIAEPVYQEILRLQVSTLETASGDSDNRQIQNPGASAIRSATAAAAQYNANSAVTAASSMRNPGTSR